MKIVLNISDKVIEDYKKEWFNESTEPYQEILEDIAEIVAERIDCPYIMDEHSKNIINYRN